MTQRFTEKQGQYLAFIYNYTMISGQAPSEADMQRFFGNPASTIHQTVLKLAELKLIKREAGEARSIQILIGPEEIPRLVPPEPR